MKHTQTIFLFLFFTSIACFAGSSKLKFEENKGQWKSNVQFKADLSFGQMFLEKDKFTYVYYNSKDMEKAHPDEQSVSNKTEVAENTIIHCHAFKVNFLNSNPGVELSAAERTDGYYNYFIGNDPSHWAANVNAFSRVNYSNLYRGIDMKVFSDGTNLTYDFIINPGSTSSQIQLRYDGADNLKIENGNLIVKTSVNEIIEYKPYSYQEINGEKHEVKCIYVLNGNVLSFLVMQKYDYNLPLVIDPVVVASTYSGSTAQNFGYCSAYDNAGNIFTGGYNFGTGYPVTVGAFQVIFGGANDIAISKLNQGGTALIYATYLGGTGTDIPWSLFCGTNNELCVYGSSNSANYPVTAGCYDNTLGGTNDIVVSHLNSTGTALIGSTYMGGSGAESPLQGEIISDNSGNIYVASSSPSSDFPTTVGAYDQTFNGVQDVVAFKLNPSCSSLLWSTFIGGSAADNGTGIRVGSLGDIYVTGYTGSNNFPTAAGSYQPIFQGGTDGFVSRLSSNASSLLSSTFYGTTGTDQSNFMDLNSNDEVHIYGFNGVNLPISTGVYGNAGSGNFIAKFNSALSTLLFQTTIGNGVIGHLSQTAFALDICGNIYIGGYGQANCPFTPNAFFTANTAATNFYEAVLSANASSLLFASYFSGTHSHATSRFDKLGNIYQNMCINNSSLPTLPGSFGPTNIAVGFDIAVFKIDFQAISSSAANAAATVSPDTMGCAPFTVTFNNTSVGSSFVWDFGDSSPLDSTLSPSHTYTNTGTFVVTLIASGSCQVADTLHLNIYVTPQPPAEPTVDTIICGNSSITLSPQSTASSYLWSTGASTSSITVSAPGTYTVTLNNNNCIATDTFNVQQITFTSLAFDTTFCAGGSVTLDAGNPTATYLWSTGANSQTITVNTTGNYWVNISINSCMVTDTFHVVVNPLPVPVITPGGPTVFCAGGSVVLTVSSAASYSWSNGPSTQSITVNSTGTFSATVTDANGCTGSTSQAVTVNPNPVLITSAAPTICVGESAVISVSGADTYTWSPCQFLSACIGSNVTANPPVTTTYTITGTDLNGCTATASITVTVNPLPIVFTPAAPQLCPGESVNVTVSGGQNYTWQPQTGLSNISADGSSVTITPAQTTTYTVTAYSAEGCSATASFTVTVNASPPAIISPAGPITICTANPVPLSVGTCVGCSYQWYMNDVIIIGETSAQYNAIAPGSYSVIVTNSFNCTASSSYVVVAIGTGPPVTIIPPPSLGCSQNTIYIGYGPQSLQLCAQAGAGAASYLWSTGETTQCINVTQPGNYSVIAYDVSGCPSPVPAVLSQPINVIDIRCGHGLKKIILCHVPEGNPGNPQTLCIAPPAIPPHLELHRYDCLGPCSLYYKASDIVEAENFYVFPYPNPFSSGFNLTILTASSHSISVNIHDMLGRLVEQYIDVTEQTIIGTKLNAGVYFAEVIQDNSRQMIQIVKAQ